MKSGERLQDIQQNVRKTKVWLESVWYNELYLETTSCEEVDHCYAELFKCDSKTVDSMISTPQQYFTEDEIWYLELEKLNDVRKKLEALRKKQYEASD
jgi:hypothetical protein